MFVGNSRDFGDRLNRADLVVGVHDADQAGVRCDRLADIIGINETAAIDGNIAHGHAKLGEMVAWLQRRRVLDLRRDDVRWPLARRAACALERKVVRFAPAAGEHDLVRGAAKQRRDLLPRIFQCCFRRRRRPMATGGISVAGLQQWPHGGNYLRVNGCAGVVVEVDSCHRNRPQPVPSVATGISLNYQPDAQ